MIAPGQDGLAPRLLLALLALLLAACSEPAPPEPQPAAPDAWLSVVRQGITRATYQPRLDDTSAIAQNRAHGLSAHFDAGVVGLGAIDGAPLGSLTLTAWGRDGSLSPAPPAAVGLGPCRDPALDVDGRCVARVDLHRPGLTEWWVNSEAGLEQGWTVQEPGGDGPLVLALGVDGFEARLEGPGSIRLDHPRRTLRYAGLKAEDADGASLPATLDLVDGAIVVTVAVDGAAWPVEIDPLVTNIAWSFEGPAYGAAIGDEVSGLGDVNGDGYGDIAVAAPGYNLGTVWVFHGSASGPSSVADWSESGWSSALYFGQSVDAAGDVNGDGYGDIIIGAPDCLSSSGCTGAGNSSGDAYVWHGGPTGLGASPAWGAVGESNASLFGMAVTGAGDLNGDGYGDVVVGAPGKTNDRGRFYVFHGSSNGLSATAWINIDGTAQGDQFSARVAGLGDVDGDGYGDVAISAPAPASPYVRVYFGGSGGINASTLYTLSGGFYDSFGSGLSDAGDVNGDGYADILVGAATVGGSSGAAYLYLGDSTRVAPSAAFAVAGVSGDALGQDVAGLGDVNGDGFADFAIGAPYADSPDDGGDVLVYLGSATNPVYQATLSSAQAYAHFGISVAAAGDVDGDGFADLLVGLDGWDGSIWENVGAAQLFLGSPAGLSASEDWSTFGNNAGAEQGTTLASAGDVNGDGYDDVLVGAPFFDNGQTDEGRAWFFAGTANGLGTTAAWTVEANVADAQLGTALAGLGDVNGDGLEDIAIGAPGYNADGGYVGIHLGSAAGPVTVPFWSLLGTSGDLLGTSAAAAGDVNGDGFADLVAGAPGYSNGQSGEGAAIVVLGGSSAPNALPAWLVEGNQSSAELGCSVAGLGDTNGDGYDDIAVGSCAHDDAFVDEGRVAVWNGSPSGPGATPDLELFGGQAGAELGTALASARDVNTDGYDDLLVGAPGWNGDDGRVDLHLGDAAGLSATPDLTWTGGTDDELGASVAGIGDVNADGYGDVALGAPGGVGGGIVIIGSSPPGVVEVHYGSATGPDTGADWTTTESQGGAEVGAAVSAAGDVNGDGVDDLLVGAPGYDDGQSDEGRVQLFLGGGGDGAGHGLSPRPRATVSSTLVPPGSRAGSNTVTLRADARPIRGAGDVRLEVEVKPLGTPFDGTGTQQSTLAFSWTGGIERTVAATLGDEERIHWRARIVADPTEGHEIGFGRWMVGGRGGSAAGSHLVGPCVADLDGDGACDSVDPDADGDGDPATTDCDDADPLRYTGAAELCDGVDNDCDSALDEDFDADGDGFYDDDASFGCATPWPNNLDCDDSDATVNPDAVEVCDGVDNDCNGVVDDAPNLPSWYWDGDGDGYGNPGIVLLACNQPANTAATGDDCDDSNAAVNPGAVEICDGLDTDCDGVTPSTETDDDGDGYDECAGLDCDDTNPAVNPVASELCDGLDTNCDGTLPADESDADADGFRPCDGDCDDLRPNVNPGATEACDGWDTDCNASTFLPSEVDGDSDGYYPCTYVVSGGNPAFAGGDCDDTDAAISPGAVEVCDGGIDNDCDPSTVEGNDNDGDGYDTCSDCDDTDPEVNPVASEFCDGKDSDCDGTLPAIEADGDSDGFVACTFTIDASPPSGLGDQDCDDALASVFPGAAEICDGLDSNCDGTTPADELDNDADTFAVCAGDCDDNEATVYPGGAEVCDGLDNDCNGTLPADEQDPDGDGVLACGGDCDDGDASVYPGAPEGCDGLDNDCDGTLPADEQDADGDGVATCDGDCDDTDPTVSPNATEICDGLDTDCDGVTPGDELDGDGDGVSVCAGDCDDTAPTVALGLPELCDGLDNDCAGDIDEDFDADGDGAFDGSDAGCASTYGAAADCDDGDASINPSASESCNGADDDCDGSVDEDFDADGDGALALSCAGGTDCDDGDASVYPGAPETCDGADNDCDGQVDETFDADADGAFDGADPGCAAVYGVLADCDDGDSSILPGADEVCDGVDQDCDGVIPGDETDNDGDGWVECPSPEAGHVGSPTGGGDCDDEAANVFPGAPELCNAVDDDCDGAVDEDFDADGDGAYDGAVPFCVATWGSAADCDDTDASVFPGAVEVCDGVDQDCDTSVDEGFDADADGWTSCGGDCDDANAAINPGVTEDCTTAYDDNCDGVTTATDADGDGVDTCSGDCDDGDATIYPGAPETCDGADQNCDGVVDDGFDVDGDGFTSCGGDCDDGDGAISPVAPETCDAVDEDCDGATDEDFDLDGDGFYDGDNPDCVAAWGSLDCDDGNPLVSPAASELCNGADEDCDGAIDEDFDADGDGSFDADNPGCAANYGALADCDDADPTTYGGAPELCDGLDNDCEGSVPPNETDDDGDGLAECDGDCDDADPGTFPGAAETCNGADDDCDGTADEDFDGDGDGFADATNAACGALADGDCDDGDAAVFPGAPELCNAVDDNCDGTLDEDFDLDGDGWVDGDDADCAAAWGDAVDCDDTDPAVFPLNFEDCTNGIDDNCNGLVDEDLDDDGDGVTTCGGDCDDTDPAVFLGAPETCNGVDDDCDFSADEDFDADGDGAFDGGDSGCAMEYGSEADCDDTDPAINPSALEVCDGIDQDCDGIVDQPFDLDGDLHYESAACQGAISGLMLDCDDADPDVYVGAPEDCADGKDNDCNFLTDGEDPACAGDDDDSTGGDDDSTGDDDDSTGDDDDDSTVDDDDSGDDDDSAAPWFYPGCHLSCSATERGAAPLLGLLLLLALSPRRRRRARPGAVPRDHPLAADASGPASSMSR